MDFAKRELEKYGWKEGKGLGKNEDGLATALQAKLKFDTTGVGHEQGKDFTYKWWENVYDNAAKNIKVTKDKEDIQMQRVADEVEITTKDYSVKDFKKKNGKMEYGRFLKTAKLTETGMVNFNDIPDPPEASKFKIKEVSDAELFAICGGRTAHKGARHGLTLSGKLARIEKQEKLLAKKLKKVSLEDNSDKACDCKKKLKKIKKYGKLDTDETVTNHDKFIKDPLKKKKHKRKKTVSFNESVVTYSIPESNTDSQSADGSNACDTPPKVTVEINMLNDNNNYINDPLNADEGIEQDCEVQNENQQNFSKMQVQKKEKEKKKKKSKDKVKSKTEIVILIKDEASADVKEVVKKKKRPKRDAQDVDYDLILMRKIKKKKMMEINELSDGLEEVKISN